MILPHRIKDKIAFDLTYGDGMGPAHLPIHNENYFTKLAERLKNAEDNGEDMRDALQKVAVDMMDETFP